MFILYLNSELFPQCLLDLTFLASLTIRRNQVTYKRFCQVVSVHCKLMIGLIILGESSKQVEWINCECIEVIPDIKFDLNSLTGRVKLFLCGNLEIGHVAAKEAILSIESMVDKGLTNAIKQADKEHSDLVPGKYEGLYLHLL